MRMGALEGRMVCSMVLLSECSIALQNSHHFLLECYYYLHLPLLLNYLNYLHAAAAVVAAAAVDE